MRRIFSCCLVAGAVSVLGPGAAWARTHGSVSGTISSITGSTITIQSAGTHTGVVNELVAAANKVTKQDTPYVYGGGHAHAGTASIGIPGRGYNGHRVGFDCSGSVAAVLAGAGLWTPGSGVPSEAWMITELLGAGLIARGAGTGPVEVTLYDDPGVHIFMNIDGRFFGTSDGGGGGDARGGAGWLNDGAPLAYSPAYKRYHFLASALSGTAGAGHPITFATGAAGLATYALGERVRVAFTEANTGVMTAASMSVLGAAG